MEQGQKLNRFENRKATDQRLAQVAGSVADLSRL